MKTFKHYRSRLIIRTTESLPFGLKHSLRNLHFELEAALAHAQGKRRAKAYAQAKELSLHLGCGENYKDGWINIDLGRHADMTLDMRRELPFADESCSIIYSEHFLEHISYPQPALSLFDEFYRLLKPGGTLSLVVPDGEMVLKAYVLGGSEEYYEAEARYHPDWCETKMQHVNYGFRQDGQHQFYYDYETLAHVLQKAGFVNIHRRQFDQKLDQELRQPGSLYVACNKI